MCYPLWILLESPVPFFDTLHKCRAYENLCVTEKKIRGKYFVKNGEKKSSAVAPKRETCFSFCFFLFFLRIDLMVL